MSENLGLGKIITTRQERDAIHIAVVPMTAGQKLQPGDKVWMENGRAMLGAINSIGVVDPFLTVSVQHGETFWLYLNPGSITSLRHEWTHPALDGEPAVAEAKRVITQMADSMGLSYAALMDYGSHHAKGWDDGYVTQQGSEDWRDGFDSVAFWPAYELVTGEKVPDDKKDHFFSCSC
jgi:hypothetical protein